MNWPVITFGRIRANVDVKKSQERQALLSYENTILEALKDVESSLVAYFNENEKLKKIEKELFAIKTKTKLQKDKYASGLIDYLNYIQQEKILIDNQIKEIESKRSLALNLIALYKALGGSDW